MSGALTQDLSSAPIDAGTFDLLLQKFTPLSERIALAISGGPDSMALAFCVQRWAQRPFVCLIVDHALRPESADEALRVKARLEALGMQAEILRWDHESVSTRLHEKAREARYRLLIEACKRWGASDLLIAHHREDQAETILMRLSKASGIEGLAGMASAKTREDVRILRPFLHLSKQRLIATCAQASIDYVTDPSNASDRFARGRLRKILPLLAEEGLTIDTLVMLGARAAEANDALDFYAHSFLRDAARFDAYGAIHIQAAALRTMPLATVTRVLSLCLSHMQRDDYPPERTSLSMLADAVTTAPRPTVRSLHGCLISLTEKQLLILREPVAATEQCRLKPGEVILWDRRWEITLAEGAEGVIAALGNPPHDLIDHLAPMLRKKVPQGRIRATLPALWRGGILTAIPSFEATNEPGRLIARYRKGAFP